MVTDPHEIANVLGVPGIRYMLESSEGLPLRVFAMASSCVPATHMETAGASLEAKRRRNASPWEAASGSSPYRLAMSATEPR